MGLLTLAGSMSNQLFVVATPPTTENAMPVLAAEPSLSVTVTPENTTSFAAGPAVRSAIVKAYED